MSNNLEMEVLGLSQEDIRDASDNEFCCIAVRADRFSNAVERTSLSIAERVHTLADKIQRKYGGHEGDCKSQLRDFYGRIDEWEKFITSKDAASYQVEELPDSITSAKLKLEYGLEHGCDLTMHSSSNKVQTWNKKHRKAAKAAKEQASIDAYAETMKDGTNSGDLEGIPGGKAGDATPSPIESKMGKLMVKLEELSGLDNDQTEDIILAFEMRIDKALTKLKGGVGSRLAG